MKRINPLTPPLLIRLVEKILLLLSKLLPTRKRTRTTNDVPGAAEDERDKVVTPTPLPRVSILFPRRKERIWICPKSNALTAIKKDITPTSVLGI